MRSRLWTLILASALLLGLGTTGLAATEVVVDGTGDTREAALQDAQRNAVATVVGQTIDSRTHVANFALVSDRILTSSQGYVKTYEVVQEGPMGSQYRIRIRAVVEDGSVRDDIEAVKLLSARRGDPRFVVVPSPSPPADALDPSHPVSAAAQAGVKQYLSERGVQLIEAPRPNVQHDLTSPAAMRDLSLWGAGLGAEYVAYYFARSYEEQSGRTFKQARAIVSLSVVHTGTYRVVAQVEGMGNGTDRLQEVAYTKAGRNAGMQAGGKALEIVLRDWTSTGDVSGNLLTLSVIDISGEHLAELEKALEGTGMVSQVNRRSYITDVATLQVRVKGGPLVLADAVQQVLDDKGWRWILEGSGGTSLTYRIPVEVKTAAVDTVGAPMQ